MTAVVAWGLIILVIVVFSYIFYIAGRDSGETKKYGHLQDTCDRLIRDNLDLKWENNRLQRAMDYYDADRLKAILDEMDGGDSQWL